MSAPKGMMLAPGWLARQFAQTAQEVASWPEWKRRDAQSMFGRSVLMTDLQTSAAAASPPTTLSVDQECLLRKVAPQVGGLEGALLRLLLDCYDAQAAQLAAMQPVADAALAWRGARGHPFEVEATAQLVAVVEAYRETGAWHDDGR